MLTLNLNIILQFAIALSVVNRDKMATLFQCDLQGELLPSKTEIGIHPFQQAHDKVETDWA
ncbi:MAG: hypothetical protein WCA64_12475 [Gallionella sp.]